MLDLNDKELLEDFIKTDTYKSLTKLLKGLIKSQEQSVLNYNIDTGDPQQLAYLRCRAEGALKLVKSLEAYLSRLNKPTASGVRRLNRKPSNSRNEEDKKWQMK